MAHPRVLAFAQLTRIPNVFTAFADIALAAAAGVMLLPETTGHFWLAVVLLALTSGCLYLGGMVWNDVFDRFEDKQTRPNRPIPSGRVRVRTAVILGVVLMIMGLGFSALAGLPAIGKQSEWNHEPLIFAIGIVIAVFIYDGGVKQSPMGPVAMGSCRFLNILLGLSILPDDVMNVPLRIELASVTGIYIVGVTWFARTEEGQSNPRHLVAAAVVMAGSLLLALYLKSGLPLQTGFGVFPYLLVVFGFFVGGPIARAVSSRKPREVQAAVKRCVLGLVGLDAVLATAFVGLPGIVIVLLLPPALLIGKWVYST
jgi:4-hydroxybenzoate polyprenyltransferase